MNMGILPLFALGSFLGSVQVGDWLKLGQLEPVGLVTEFGSLNAILITLLGLSIMASAARLWVGKGRTWWERKWLLGALFLAILAALNLIVAGQPWGVVYGFGLWAAKIATAMGAFDPAGNAFWSQAGNAQRLNEMVLMDITSITNIGILGGALWISARAAGTTPPMTSTQWIIGLVAGFLMGYSSRLAFGCNIGAMLSGISTGSVHGWIWVPLAFAGTLIGVRLRRHYQF